MMSRLFGGFRCPEGSCLEEVDELSQLLRALADLVVDLQAQGDPLRRLLDALIPLLQGLDGNLDPDRVSEPSPSQLLHRFGLCR